MRSGLFGGPGDLEGNVAVSEIAVAINVGVAVTILLSSPLKSLQGKVDVAFIQCDLDQERGVPGLLEEREQLTPQALPAIKPLREIAQFLVAPEKGLCAEQCFGYLQFGNHVVPVAIVFLEPFQEVQRRFLLDACSHQALGHGILSMLDEQVDQSERSEE